MRQGHLTLILYTLLSATATRRPERRYILQSDPANLSAKLLSTVFKTSKL